MKGDFCGFIPYIDERAWWANTAALGNRDCSCSGCGRETYEAAMDDVSELCFVCAVKLMPDSVVIVEDEREKWSEERRVVEAWLLARGL